MAISKQKVLDTISAMPEEELTDVDVLLERIMILEKIEKKKKISRKEKHTHLKRPNNIWQNGFDNMDRGSVARY